jgi:hypothetical protein
MKPRRRVTRAEYYANRRIYRMWRSGRISFVAFDWWLRTMSGV